MKMEILTTEHEPPSKYNLAAEQGNNRQPKRK